MSCQTTCCGVFAAAVTPLNLSGGIESESVPVYLGFLAERGCHGALLLGTTGEGPSFSHAERVKLMQAAVTVRQQHPRFRLLAGTGTPSLEETIANTRSAFDIGMDGVVVLPPYYYRNASDDGLYEWFYQLIKRAVPLDGSLFGYHIPSLSGVPLSVDLVSRLKDAFPHRFSGLKDSSSSPEHAVLLGKLFGKDLTILNGNDKLFSIALEAGASGCITAMASLCSPLLRRVWDAHLRGNSDPVAQQVLDSSRAIMDKHPPAPPLVKSILAVQHQFPRWSVRPPLLDLTHDAQNVIAAELESACNV